MTGRGFIVVVAPTTTRQIVIVVVVVVVVVLRARPNRAGKSPTEKQNPCIY